MNLASQIFAALAAVLHILIFGLESLWFMRPAVYRRFGAANALEAGARRLFAFNQGFYNLFLAAGVLAGLALIDFGGGVLVGRTLVLFGCACMLGAAVVLLASARKVMLRAAIVQGIFPLLAWLFWLAR